MYYIAHKVNYCLLNVFLDFHGLILNSSFSSPKDIGSKTKKLLLYFLINLEQYLLRKKKLGFLIYSLWLNGIYQNLQELPKFHILNQYKHVLFFNLCSSGSIILILYGIEHIWTKPKNIFLRYRVVMFVLC